MAAIQRQSGRRALLKEIRQNGPVPRIELADRTGISRTTVTTITAEFLEDGLIEEVARPLPEDAPRGRPRVDLRIRGRARLVVGAKISHQSVSFVLMDFNGTQLTTLERDLPDRVLPSVEMSKFLTGAIEDLAEQAGFTLADVSGVGVGIAGIVEASRGFVYWSPSLAERNVEFGRDLSQALGRPAFVDNDANLVAVAEQAFGLGKGHSDFIVVTIESGVGMGIVLGGELYRGTRGCGAEFGHTKVQLDGALCRCGQRGCLEAYVADYALMREAALLKNHEPMRFEQLLQAARSGEPMAQSILARAGRIFAMGLANLVNIFDPELIILAGEQMQFDHLIGEDMIDTMRQSIVQIDKSPPEVVTHKWGNLMWARGAAAYALDNVSELALTGLGDRAV